MPGAPRMLDSEPGLADPTKTVDRLRLGNRRGRPILELAELFIAAFEEVSEPGEGEVVEMGAESRDRARLLTLVLFFSLDAPDQEIQPIFGQTTPEIYPGES